MELHCDMVSTHVPACTVVNMELHCDMVRTHVPACTVVNMELHCDMVRTQVPACTVVNMDLHCDMVSTHIPACTVVNMDLHCDMVSTHVPACTVVNMDLHCDMVSTHIPACTVVNMELHCDMVPKTCENFLKHCQNKYYKGTQFHRSIRNFMIQGGDPTATGKGGESIWGKPFKDEFKPNLTHTGRGVLSMANSGPNTNKSQFFITYRSCNHLDRKHTVFGRVVGGLDTLTAMEKVECDSTDKPQEDILITDTLVFVDPYEEAETLLAAERRKQQAAEEEERKSYLNIPVKRKKEEGPKVFKTGVGKYINMASASASTSTSSADPGTSKQTDTAYTATPPKKKVKSSSKLTDFSAW
ncbi:RING-type E3 ubiquitin-protein ligase PPIL2-like isoform X2 [Branchiostoma floridae]|uniref:RING-type E3 ubiquitin-protein ligase PPIL2-like isoform X2 n=1 Tax=Branchiostoma floridae TaxID=7739 RepID=A0A9J7N338_BRAFL|nr:RING-type E3 ubiquitin-protein ligase PPIL2-like isoform X2 [Branchiostoma floridae]